MAQGVLRQEQVRVPVRLEVRLRAATSFVQPVLVGVKQTGVWGRHDRLGHVEQRFRRESVVRVEQADPVTVAESNSIISGRGNVAIGLTEGNAKAWIGAV